MSRSLRVLPSVLLAGLLVSSVSPSFAAAKTDNLQASLARQDALIKEQQALLNEQKAQLAQQAKEIAENRAKLDALIQRTDAAAQTKLVVLSKDQQDSLSSLTQTTDEEMRAAVGAGKPSGKTPTPAKAKSESTTTAATATKAPATNAAATSITPPAKEEKRPEVAALADVGGVLTPKGVLMYENSPEYVNTTSNLFTFNGVQVAEVVFIGVPSSSSVKRQILQDSNRFRLGLTNRLEADMRVPYVYRNDTTTETSGSTTTRNTLEGHGFGDIDGGLAYQINQGKEGWPFFVGNLRYKANNADGPFDVPYDADSIATRLPTGTGFHSAEASLTAIKVSDPAILFGNLGYVYNIKDTINKTFGNTRVLEVDPGDAINASAGLGFSINPETSFTLGYKHSYVFKTEQETQNVSTSAFSTSESDTASVGALMVGASYRFSPITSLSMNVEVGATREAPDVRVGFRIPVRLGTLF